MFPGVLLKLRYISPKPCATLTAPRCFSTAGAAVLVFPKAPPSSKDPPGSSSSSPVQLIMLNFSAAASVSHSVHACRTKKLFHSYVTDSMDNKMSMPYTKSSGINLAVHLILPNSAHHLHRVRGKFGGS